MLKRILMGGGVAAVLLAGAVAVAQAPQGGQMARPPTDRSLGPADNNLPGYFKVSPIDGKAVLGPPPAPDSPQGIADRTVFEQTRALKDSPRWKTAIQDNDLWAGGALQRFSCALGVDVNARQTPVLWRMLHRLEADVRLIGTPAKQFYDRKRPLIGNDLPICVPREDWMKTNASYPSGHAMTAWSWGLLMSEIYPQRSTEVLALARDSGWSRVVCGVHFPSDIEAGRTLGSSMVASLHDLPAFRSDLAKAKAELARAKPLSCPAP